MWLKFKIFKLFLLSTAAILRVIYILLSTFFNCTIRFLLLFYFLWCKNISISMNFLRSRFTFSTLRVILCTLLLRCEQRLTYFKLLNILSGDPYYLLYSKNTDRISVDLPDWNTLTEKWWCTRKMAKNIFPITRYRKKLSFNLFHTSLISWLIPLALTIHERRRSLNAVPRGVPSLCDHGSINIMLSTQLIYRTENCVTGKISCGISMLQRQIERSLILVLKC